MEEKLNATLTIEAGEQQGKTFCLNRNTILMGRGQTEENKIAFSTPFVSRQHAEIRYSNDSFILRDLGSKNGTRVNGKSLESMVDYRLKDNDAIDLARGAVVLRFCQAEHTTDIVTEELQMLVAQALPESTVTILFSDIQGFTSLADEKGDNVAYEMLKTHNELVRQAVKSRSGFEVKTAGDSFMITFSSATKAVLCAIDIQKALEKQNQKHPDQKIHVRVGLNTGEPISEGKDFFGGAVNLAARIAAKAEGDEILVSQLVKNLAVVEGIRYLDRGLHWLSGFKYRQRIYEVVWREYIEPQSSAK